jgi:hypothetical protein
LPIDFRMSNDPMTNDRSAYYEREPLVSYVGRFCALLL